MVSMKNIRKRLAAIVLSVSAIFGGLALAGIADAGTYTTATTCAHATAGNRICFDISAGTVTVYDNSNAVVAGPTPATLGFGTPSRGWIAYDYECNANGANETVFNTPGGYGLPTTLTITDNSFPIPGKIQVNTSAKNTIAWYANSNQGYECFIVN
jgi:hypothetical protein